MIYWAEQDLVVADEYRDGNVPAGMDNLRLIQRGFASLPAMVTEDAFRSDSAWYDEAVLKWLANPQWPDRPQGQIAFTISADMTPELRAKCAAIGERHWVLVEGVARPFRRKHLIREQRVSILKLPREHEMAKWTEADVGNQNGRTVLVTGGNSGIGWDTARVLAAKGAKVLLSCRNPERGEDAILRLRDIQPNAQVQLLHMDLADLDSVRASAARVRREHANLDLLINNAGLMATPQQRTAQGFEMQFGVNHLGHFALTGLLLPQLLRTPGSRIVTVSSNGHRPGRIRFDDLHWHTDYSPWAAYFQSKLANLLFTYELQRKLSAAGSTTAALAAHPGGSKTNLGNENPGGFFNTLLVKSRPLIERFLLQSSAMGALPTLRAAVDPDAQGGEYYGPDGIAEQMGYPVRVNSSRRSHDPETARRLWEVSADLTGVKHDFTVR